MLENPLVSIIIPVYNRADRVAQTLDSIIAQTYTKIEIILVDDGSTDDSEQVIIPYLSETVKYYKQANAGAPAARNRGISMAKGAFIIFFDSDDLMLPSRVEEQVKAVLLIQADACACGYFINTIDGDAYFPPLQANNDLIAQYVNLELIGSTQSWMFSRKLVHEVGGFDLSLTCRQDSDITFRILQLNPKVAMVNRALSLFIDHEGGERIMNNWTNPKHHQSKERYHKKILDYLADHNRIDLIHKAIDRFYWDVVPAYVKCKEYGQLTRLYGISMEVSKKFSSGDRLKIMFSASRSLVHWLLRGLKK